MITYKSPIQEYNLKIESKDSNFKKAKITTSLEAYDYIKQFYFDDINIYESFFILLLNRSNNTKGYVKISQGGIMGTVVDIKIICKYVVDSLASGVILAHNHPSGEIKPSEKDISLTKNVKDALRIFESTLMDHIILSEDKFYSFGDEGTLTK